MIVVDKKSLETLANKIQGLNMKDPRIAHAMGGLLVRSTRQRIRDTKKSPKNKDWIPRSETTLEILRKTRRGDIGSLLMLSGQLYQSVGYSTARFMFNGELSVYSNKEYAGYLQKGTKKMPARPFLGLSSDDYKNIRAMLIRHAHFFLLDKKI
ncbi:MAG: phage virion morphogenesis protein [Brevinema sp.]